MRLSPAKARRFTWFSVSSFPLDQALVTFLTGWIEALPVSGTDWSRSLSAELSLHDFCFCFHSIQIEDRNGFRMSDVGLPFVGLRSKMGMWPGPRPLPSASPRDRSHGNECACAPKAYTVHTQFSERTSVCHGKTRVTVPPPSPLHPKKKKKKIFNRQTQPTTKCWATTPRSSRKPAITHQAKHVHRPSPSMGVTPTHTHTPTSTPTPAHAWWQ